MVIKLKDVVSHLNHVEKLSTPQFTHLPCVREYLKRQSESNFMIDQVCARDIVENITSFCHSYRKAHALHVKISRLEDE